MTHDLIARLDKCSFGVSLALEALSDHCRDHSDVGFTVRPQDCRLLSAAFALLAAKGLTLEMIEQTARAKAVADGAVADIASGRIRHVGPLLAAVDGRPV